MPVLFTFAAVIAIVTTVLAITRLDVVHALLYLAVSLLAVAVAIYALGAPYLAALEVIIYAGAIIVLFVFVTMMLNLGQRAKAKERLWQPGRGWIGPAVLGALLLIELAWTVFRNTPTPAMHWVGPEAVGARLMGEYLVGVELTSMLLLAAVVAAYHLGYGLVSKQQPAAVEDQNAKVTSP